MQQLINVHTALSIRQSFILLIHCKGQQQQNISLKIEQNTKNRRQWWKKVESGKWRYGNCSTCRLNSRQSSSKREENSVQKDIGKRIGNRAYRVVSQSSVLLSPVNEWEPDNTKYVWHAAVSCRWLWLPYVFVLYTSLGAIKIFGLSLRNSCKEARKRLLNLKLINCLFT